MDIYTQLAQTVTGRYILAGSSLSADTCYELIDLAVQETAFLTESEQEISLSVLRGLRRTVYAVQAARYERSKRK